MTQTVDLTIVIGTFAGMLAGFYGIAKVMLKQAAKDRDSDRLERQELSKAIEHMAKNSGKVAEATERAAKEAAERNGHLGEQHETMILAVQHIADTLDKEK